MLSKTFTGLIIGTFLLASNSSAAMPFGSNGDVYCEALNSLSGSFTFVRDFYNGGANPHPGIKVVEETIALNDTVIANNFSRFSGENQKEFSFSMLNYKEIGSYSDGQ